MSYLRKTALALLLLAQAALLLQVGCAGTTGGGNLAAPPAPLAELPSVLQIPNDLSIDVDKTRSETGSLMTAQAMDPYFAAAAAKFLTSGGCGDGTLDAGEQCDDGNAVSGDGCDASCRIENFSEEISFSANLVFFSNSRLRALLGPLSSILIPVDENLRRMESIIFIGTKPYIARLNFDDFDLDGIGGAEGCSGHTASLPICVRVWVDDGVVESRLFAARFDEFPLPENPGAGSLRGQDITFGGVDSGTQTAANYDWADPLNKFTDSYFGFIDEKSFGTEVGLPIRAFASQAGPDATALKTTNGSALDPEINSFGKGFGRWREDRDFWIGSFQSNDPPREFRDQCARISTGEGVSTELFCDPLDLNTAGLDFLPFATYSDLAFFDFPPSAP